MYNNQQVIDQAFERFSKQIEKETEKRLKSWCSYILMTAIFNRIGAKGAHNFTGNLLNSICVGLYKGSKLISEHYASNSGYVRSPIRRKMTVRNGVYYFQQDYDGREHYVVDPRKATWLQKTDEGHGSYDARRFLWSYKPTNNNMFTIAVAYTAEYSWGAITGYAKTFMDTKYSGERIAGLRLVGLKVS